MSSGSDIERKSVIVQGFSESNLSAPFLPSAARFPINLIQFGYNLTFSVFDTIPPVRVGPVQFWPKLCQMFASHFTVHLTRYSICSYRQNELLQQQNDNNPFFAGVGPDGTKYKTAYKCEGEQLTISCASDQTIKVTPSLYI